MKAEALWVVEPNKVEIREVEIKPPGYDEVQIEIKACGVCAWDASLYQGKSNPKPIPYTFGHEGVGFVRAIGDGVKSVKVGDKVCAAAAANDMFMQYCNQPESSVAKIPDNAEWKDWIVEPVVCVVNILYKVDIQPGDRIALIGAGYMGQLTLQGLQAEPYGELVVFEPREDYREMSKQYHNNGVYDPSSPEGLKKIEEIKNSGGFEIVIELSASKSGYDLACQLTKNVASKLVLGSWHRQDMVFDSTRWHLDGVSVLNLAPNSNAYFKELIPATVKLIERGVYNPGKLVTHVVDYHDAVPLFLKAIDKSDGYMKGVITF